MHTVQLLPDLQAIGTSVQLLNESIISNVSDGVAKVTKADGTLGTIKARDAVASDEVATLSQLNTAIADLVDGAPAVLDTLKELADSLGDDPDIAGTITTLIGEVNQDVVDMNTALGILENASHMGVFTGSTIADNHSVRDALQALETAVELRAMKDNAILTGTVEATLIKSTGAHMRVGGSTNDFFIDLLDQEALQITLSGSQVRYTATGGSGTHKFNGDVDIASLNGRVATEDHAKMDNGVDRVMTISHSDANGGVQTDWASSHELPVGLKVLRVSIRVGTTAFDNGAVLKIGKSGTDDYFATIDANTLSIANAVTSDPVYLEIEGSDVLPTFTLSGSPSQGSVKVFIECSA